MPSYKCESCSFTANQKCNYIKHLESERHKIIYELISSNNKKLEELTVANHKLIVDIENKSKMIDEYKRQNSELNIEVKLLRDMASRPITVNNLTSNNMTNNNNKITNNLLTFLSPEIIDHEKLKRDVVRMFSSELILKGDNALVNAILDPLRDRNGKYKIACTDPSRQTFRYKDDDGKMMTDIGLESIFESLRIASEDKFNRDIKDELYDAAQTVDKEGRSELNTSYYNKLTDRARFRSKKFKSKIAQKTHINSPDVKINFIEDMNEKIKEDGRAEWNNRANNCIK